MIKLSIAIKSLLVVIFYVVVMQCLHAQPYPVGHRQVSITDPARAGRLIGLEIYYPGVSSGDDVEVASGQFPVLVFGHGFLMVWSAYQPYWETLVPEGYILAFPTTEGTFSPSHGDFGSDLARIRSWIQSENILSGSVWENHISLKSAVMGHSMGGGAAFLAMQADTQFTALVGIAAAETTPSAIQASSSISRPVLILAGQNDCVTPIAQHQQPMFDGLASASRCLITINGGSHCQFAASNFFCNTGESSCQPAPTITGQAQQSLSFQALIPWLDFYLKDNCTAGPVFQQFVANTSGISVQQTGILNCATTRSEDEKKFSTFTLYPNPSDGLLRIHIDDDTFSTVEIWDFQGRKLYSFISEDGNINGIGDIPGGIYRVRVLSALGRVYEGNWNVVR